MLQANDLVHINKTMAENFGGSSGLRDRGLLESAIARYDMVKHYTNDDPIMAMVEGIIQNHPFVDGNKRTALVALFVCHALQGQAIYIDGCAMAAMIDGLASKKVEAKYITDYVDENTHDYMWRDVDHLMGSNPELVKALDILARKDANELTEEELEYFV